MYGQGDLLDLSDPRLPAPLPVMPLLVDLLREQDIAPEQLVHLLTDNPGLAEDTLNFINSPVFNPKRPLVDIRRAAVLMGSRSITLLSLAVSVIDSYRQQPLNGLRHNSFWTRLLLSAVAARLVAEREDDIAIDEAIFVASFQDIGMLVIDAIEPGFYASIADQWHTHTDLKLLEGEFLGCDHAAISTAVMRKWGLPDALADAAALSHLSEPPVGSGKTERLGCIARIASQMADLPFSNEPDLILQQLHSDCTGGLQWQEGQLAMQLHMYRNAFAELSPMAQRLGVERSAYERLAQVGRERLQPRRLETAFRAPAKPAPELHHEADVEEVSDAIDPLTGLYNRASFPTLLQSTLNNCEYDQQPLTLIMLSVSNFPRIARERGDQASHSLLTDIARVLDRNTRRDDLVARISDAVFAIALPDAPGQAADSIARRFVERVNQALADSFTEARLHAVPTTQADNQPYLSAQALLADASKALLAQLRSKAQ
mgnify:CR=1 FL=1